MFGAHESTGHKKEESTMRKAHRARYPRQLHDGAISTQGQVAHRLILRIEGRRTRVTHRKRWNENIGGAVYNKAKRMLGNE
jgi:hypothetical protein